MKTRKGISTLEFIVACAISTLALAVAMQVTHIFRKAAAQSAVLYSAQIGTRNSAAMITERLRNASAIFLLPSKFFSPERLANLPKDFSFFGVEEENGTTRLVNYIMKEDGSGHERIVIADSSDGVSYKIILNKYLDDSSAENLVGVTIICEGEGVATQKITTSVKAFNARIITDWSSGSDAVAIAYSPDSESASNPDAGAAIYATVDNSASMTYGMDTTDTAQDIEQMRAYYLRKAATGFLDALSPYNNVYLGAQGFFQYASAKQNMPLASLDDPQNARAFQNLFNANFFSQNYASFNTSVANGGNWTLDPSETLGLGPGTNIGDGIRASFYRLLYDAQNLGIGNFNKYMIILSDGEPNAATYDVTRLGAGFDPDYIKSLNIQDARNYYYRGRDYATAAGDLETASGETLRHRASDDPTDRERGMAYALEMADTVFLSGMIKDIYLIGIGELSPTTLNLLAQSLGISGALYDERVFSASNAFQLSRSFEAAASGIAVDLEGLLGKSLLEGIED